MLHFNGFFQREEEDPIWKVFVFDPHTQNILSPLLKVSQLRNEGVTVFRTLSSIDDSCAISDVPVLFFVQPTDENIKQICSLLRRDIFSCAFVNWSGFVSKRGLELLAEQSARERPVCFEKIFQVYDMFCDFVCLDETLFVLSKEISFLPSGIVAQEAEVEELAQELLCVFATTGQIPIVRCRAGASRTEMIARRLVELVKDQLLMGKGNIFDQKASSVLIAKRPLLVLVDRSEDLVTPWKHSWSYNAMLHDLFGIVQNRICIPGKKEKYDLDLDEDFIWNKFAQLPTFEVASGIDQELNAYLQEKEQISRITGIQDVENQEAVSHELENKLSLQDHQQGNLEERERLLPGESPNKSPAEKGAMLRDVIERIPELTKKKKLLDMHTNFATDLIKTVGEKKLDQYVLYEAQAQSLTDERIIASLIGPEAPGNEFDRIRFLLILLLSNDKFIQKIEHLKGILSLPHFNEAIDAIIALKSGQLALSAPTSPTMPSAAKYYGAFQHSRVVGMLGSFVSGIKNLLPDSTELPITKITESLLRVASGTIADDFLYLDPKQLLPNDRLYVPDKDCFDDVFVFITGGATYSEWNCLQQLAKRYPKLRITLGSTEMLTAESFLHKFTNKSNA